MRTIAAHSWTHIRRRAKVTFAALSIRNYRLFFIGQSISLSGTWMQTLAQGWLVLQLTGSATQVGLVVAAQFLPLLFVTPFGGTMADSWDKRRIFYWTQIATMLLALGLGLLVVFDYTQLWMVYVFAIGLGCANAIANPTRQAFVSELVDDRHLKNAVTLHAIANNLARAVGPTIAAVLIAAWGIGFCFLANAASTIAILYTLSLMREKELHRTPKKKGHANPLKQLREGFNYARKQPIIRDILLMILVIGTLTYEFQTTLPVFAKVIFESDATGYAHLWVAFGIGSVVGGLVAAGQKRVAPAYIVRASLLFGISVIVAGLMPNLQLATLAMFVVGYFSITFLSNAHTTIQLEAEPSMRGRVMALWTMAMLGSTPLGSAIVGFLADEWGARWGLIVGGLAALACGLIAVLSKLDSERILAIPAALKASIFSVGVEEEQKFK
ncbi:MAG TPA: MFS transporter [Candidatus Paceibacterota bacterium]